MNMSQGVVLENTEYRQKCGWGSKDSWGRGRPAYRGENWSVVSIDDVMMTMLLLMLMVMLMKMMMKKDSRGDGETKQTVSQ